MSTKPPPFRDPAPPNRRSAQQAESSRKMPSEDRGGGWGRAGRGRGRGSEEEEEGGEGLSLIHISEPTRPRLI
eukprot:39881-Rhodomonas_salina.4